MNIPNDSSLPNDGNGVSFTARSEGIRMINSRPGSVEDDDGDDEDATSTNSGNHLGSAAADEGAARVGYATRPCHSISPLSLWCGVLTAIHTAGLRKEGRLAMAQTSGQ